MLIFPFVAIGKLIALFGSNKNYRVWFFFPFYHIGGAEKIHAQIAQAAGGPDCIIYFTRRSHGAEFKAAFEKSGCVTRDISKFTDNKWLYFLNLVWRGIISGKINRQTQITPTLFNGQCNFAYKISPWIKASVKQIELIHSFNSFSFIRTPFLPFITTSVMISHQRIKDHLAYYRRINVPEYFDKRIEYVSNGSALPDHPPVKPETPFTVIYVGRGGLEKRVPLIMEIAEQLQTRQQQISFEILGDVSDVVDESKYPFVKFHGSQNNPDYIADVYSRAHALLLTSTTEGFPLVVIEAMGFGCAILATPVGDIPEHIKPGVNGFLFSSVDDTSVIKEEAIGAILNLFNHRDVLDDLFFKNISYANANFSLDLFNASYRRILNNGL